MSTRRIRIDYPEDGAWVLAPGGGRYNHMMDHVIALHRDGRIAGGVVFTAFMGAAMFLHMRGSEDNWATRDFLWMVFDYAFNQCGCRKLFGMVKAENTRAYQVDRKLGFHEAYRFTNVTEDGDDVYLMEMDRAAYERGSWSKVKPSLAYHRSNKVAGHG